MSAIRGFHRREAGDGDGLDAMPVMARLGYLREAEAFPAKL